MIAKLYFFLVNGVGLKMSLMRDGLREAKEMAWDAETNRPISWEDQMLNDMGNECPIWSGTKTQITNLKDVLQEGKIE